MAYHTMYSIRTDDKLVRLFPSLSGLEDYLEDLMKSGVFKEYDSILIEKVRIFYYD